MTSAALTPTGRLARQTGWRADFALGVIIALLSLGMHVLRGLPSLAASSGDNDSLLRLVEVRDLIAGQGWFDLHQYRMGLPDEFSMHWSRLVDAPLAAMVWVASALTGSAASGETVALIAWPLLLFAVALTLMIRLARAIGDEWALVPAIVIGGTTLHFIGAFQPGKIDHHNVQLVLTLAAATALSVGRGFAPGLVAGAACALMLAIGMETLPYVAVAGLVASVAFLFGTREDADKACGFGLAIAAAGTAAFLGTVPASAWLVAQCDAYSIPQFSIALVAGCGLAVASGVPLLRENFSRRLACLAALAAVVAAAAILLFPECLQDPYADLDPRIQQYFLSNVTEAQPVWSFVLNAWPMAVNYYVTPLLGLVVLGWRILTKRPSGPVLTVTAFLAAAIAVSLWQVRGSVFALPFGAVSLAAWVGDIRQRATLMPTTTGSLSMILAWLVSFNFAWGLAADTLSRALGGQGSPTLADTGGTCDRAADYAALADQPGTLVLAVSNLGAPILAHTHHRVLAAPYHRNTSGILLALDAFMGTADEAHRIVRERYVGLVAVCRGNAETHALAEWAPAGFLAAVVGGNVPAWLEKLPVSEGQALDIYRVRPGP